MTAVFPEPYKVPSMAAPSGVLNVMLRTAGIVVDGIGKGVEDDTGAAHAVSKKIRSRAKEMVLISDKYNLPNKKNTHPREGYFAKEN